MAKMLSIDIGITTTQIVEMDFQSKKPKIYKCIEIQTPAQVVEDGYLKLNNIEALKEAIKEALKANKIRTKRVLFTVFSGKIITREIMLPRVKDHQISAVIESNLNEYFPIELDDYKIAHLKIQTFNEGDNEGRHKVLVIAAEKILIEGYEKLAELLNLNIVDVDYSGNSIYQASKQRAGAEAIMVVRVERENAIITIIKKGIMEMQRNVNFNPRYQSDDESTNMEEASHTLVGTVLRIIDFYLSKDESAGIEKIYFVGEGSKDKALMELMREHSQISCEPLEVIKGVTLTKFVQDCQVNLFAASIGAGISSVGFDTEKEKERHETNYLSASLLMTVLIIVVAVALVSLSIVPYNAALIEQNSLEKKQRQLEPAKAVYDQYNGMTAFITKIRYGNALTHNSNDAILDFLAELEEMLPTDVEVSDFTSDDTECVISMRVSDKETAAGVINNFRNFESLSSVVVTSLTEETADNEVDDDLSSDNKIINFTITAEYNVETLVEPVSSDTSVSTTSDDDIIE
jgi:Tfp pilus assembly PilM family ATPase